MMHLLTSPEAWAALLTLTSLEIVLGIDNVIFLSVIVSRIPERQARRARCLSLIRNTTESRKTRNSGDDQSRPCAQGRRPRSAGL